MIVQADDGTIYLMADAFPYGTGSARSQAGSGMITVDGCKYLALTEKGNSVTDMKNFTLYIKEDGTVWDSRTDSATDYSVDEDFNLYKNGSALTVQQRDPSLQYNGTRVPMNIFYEDSELQVYRTSYLWMASSSDGGKTWSAPQILNSLKLESESFLGFGPGRGYVISQGEYKGRILIPVYSTEGTRGERSSVIYSDDNGKTWNRGPASTLTSDSALDPGKTSESQFVELPDGTIRMYARGNTGYVAYADSADGVNYGTFKEDPQLAYCGNSMVSVINYSQMIDGRPALILSCPEHRENRKDGIIRIGLINENTDPSAEEKYTVEWKYRYEVNRDEFIYSCLTELPNGDIGLLYETHVDNVAPLNYAEYKLEDLLIEEDSTIDSIELLPEQPEPGDEIEVKVTLKEPAVNPEELDGAVLEILYPGSGLGKGTLNFDRISEDDLVLNYTGVLPESDTGYEFLIRMPEWCSHPTVGKKSPVVETAEGLVNPANKDTLYGTASEVKEPAGEVDKTDLEAAVKYAKVQQEEEYYQYVVPAVKTLFEEALADAEAVNADAEASQEEVDAAYKRLVERMHLLDYTGNPEELQLAYDLAAGLDLSIYTEESRQVMEDALARAKEVLEDENALQAEIDQALESLNAAREGLELIPTDKTKLAELLAEADEYAARIDSYTAATADTFLAAYEGAKEICADDGAVQEEVDASYASLQNAIFGLREIPNKDKLQELIDEAKGIIPAEYTDESAQIFTAALSRAAAVMRDENADRDDVEEAENALRAAMDSLAAREDAEVSDPEKQDVPEAEKNVTASDDRLKEKTGTAAFAGGSKAGAESLCRTSFLGRARDSVLFCSEFNQYNVFKSRKVVEISL